MRARFWVGATLALGFLAITRSTATAQSIDPYRPPAGTREKVTEEAAPRIAERGTIERPLVLRPARERALDQIEAMEAWNRAGRTPAQVGFTRRLPDVITATFPNPNSPVAPSTETHSIQLQSSAGVALWGTKVTVKEAFGVRLHLSSVHLPPGTRLWSYGTEGEPKAYGLELVGPGDDIWAPITFGETSYLEVEVPLAGADYGFKILELAEVRPLAAPAEPPCALDAACVTSSQWPIIGSVKHSVAALFFITGSALSSCTGTLLNDVAQDGAPYLLTANHCLPTQTEASTLVAIWDYYASSCGGAVPSASALPTSSGGKLLASGSASDFALLLLYDVPPGRWFMGWNSLPSAAPQGTTLLRVACPGSSDPLNPYVFQQQVSGSTVDASSATCRDAPRPDYLYSAPVGGYTYHGSSGSAALLQNGQVVGQLHTACGTLVPCAQSFELTDGAFSATYPSIASWISAPTPVCVPNDTTLCLSTRFKVTATWKKSDGTTGQGNAVVLTPDTGYFWFFDQSNVEVVTKVLSGCALNSHYWVFGSGLTNVGVTLTYTDVANGTPKQYQNSVGAAFAPIQDTTAFATCP